MFWDCLWYIQWAPQQLENLSSRHVNHPIAFGQVHIYLEKDNFAFPTWGNNL